MIKAALRKAFKTTKGKIPGAIAPCVWEQVTSGGYDPVTGGNTSVTTSVSFEGALSEYGTHEKQIQGIEAGDVRLIAIADIEKPSVGDVITIDDVAHEVVNVGDYAGIAFDMQMRRK